MDGVDSRPHAQIFFGTLTFEVKARDPARPFIMPFFVPHVIVVVFVSLVPQLDFNARPFSVLDDAPS